MWGHRAAAVPAPSPVQETPGLIEARRVRRAATDDLVAAIEQGGEVRDIVARVHEHGRRNHWGEMLAETFDRGSQR